MRRTFLVALIALPIALNAQAPSSAATIRSAARAYRTAHETEILKEFTDLLAIPNLASDNVNIRRNAAALAQMLEKHGIPAQLLEVEGAPPAVFGELRTPGATRTLVLYAHYDGQPVVLSQWDTPPWTPTTRNGRIYARSAGDDKATIIAILAALDAMKSAKLQPSVNLKFFFEGEEEAGSAHLDKMLAAHRGVLHADAWIFGDGPNHQSGQQQVQLGVRGVMGMELTLYVPNRELHSGHN
jgi:acetylornithine deacetylase/succinyl-diaminopimelate desuccinylase-like protein